MLKFMNLVKDTFHDSDGGLPEGRHGGEDAVFRKCRLPLRGIALILLGNDEPVKQPENDRLVIPGSSMRSRINFR